MSLPPVLWVTIGADPPARLDKALYRDTPEEAALSRTRLARMIAEGDVLRGGVALTKPTSAVTEGDVIELRLGQPQETRIAAEAIPLTVAYEDTDLIVIDKPAGMVVHPAPGSPDRTLVNALLAHCGDSLSGVGGVRRPGIVHRIDKDTSGLLVAAKSDRAHHGLAEQFAAHSVDRRYLALVHGVPDPGDPRLVGLAGVAFETAGVLRVDAAIGRNPRDRQKQAVLAAGGRRAVTRTKVIRRFGSPAVAAMVDCWLETGRTHQIRVHMTHIGHGLIGDPVYGGRRRISTRALPPGAAELVAAFPRQALHAAQLGFQHPVTGERLNFSSDLPNDMAGLVRQLVGDPDVGPSN